MTDFRTHRKQFLICSAGKHLPESDWLSVSLTETTILYHCPELRVEISINPLGQTTVLLGTAVECVGDQSPGSRLREITRENWLDITDTWGNRWVLIIGQAITTDASGMLGVFFPDAQYRHDNFAVSSSPRLLGELFPGCDKPVRGVTYAPATPMAGINCLLPGQWLDVETGEIEQPRQSIFKQIDKTPDEIRQECCAIMKKFMQQVFEIEKRTLWVSLSGGADSRRNLAAAVASGIPYQPFSFLKKYWQTSDADRKLPRKLGRVIGIETLLIYAGKYLERSDLAKAYRNHTSFRDILLPGELFYYFSGGHWEHLPATSAVVDGQNYELVGNYYYREVGSFESAQDMLNWHFECPRDKRSLSLEYIGFASGGSMSDLRDFAFLLANSSVYGQMYQAMDLWCDVYVPANCRRLYSLAQSVRPDLRQDKAFWISVTNSLEPRFARIPTNPRDGLFKFLVNLVRRRGIYSTISLFARKSSERIRRAVRAG